MTTRRLLCSIASLALAVACGCEVPPTATDGGTDARSELCGNGSIDGAEACDIAWAAGEAGACPTVCMASDVCVEATLVAAGTCAAACVERERAVGPADGCCPAGADATRDTDCPASCGNGEVDVGERCDTAIAAEGMGACPDSCPSPMGCARSTLVSADTCLARCTSRTETAFIDADACCPAGGNALVDSDCVPTCGNRVVEPPEECDDGNADDTDGCDSSCARLCGDGVVAAFETCDVAIAAGPGSCPADCTSADPCQIATLRMPGTCRAMCTTTLRTSSVDGDGCCLPGSFMEEDDDCPMSSCGDGLVQRWEGCDTRIASGAGRCPTSCDDMLTCTLDSLSGAGSCAASCMHTTITALESGDGCCPSGADTRTDGDCVATIRCDPRLRIGSTFDDASEVVLGQDTAGDTIAAWVDHSPTGSDDIQWSRFDAVMGRWGTPRSLVSIVSDDAVGLVLAHDRTGSLVAAWIEHDPASSDSVDWGRLDETTDTWSREKAVAGIVSDDAVSLVLTHDRSGALVAAWIERDADTADSIDWSRLDEATDLWSRETGIAGIVSDDATTLVFSEDRSGALVAAWIEHDPTGSDTIDWSRLDEATDGWSHETSVAGIVSEDATELVLSHDRAGALVAAWIEHERSSADTIDWARLDEASDLWSGGSWISGIVSDDATDLALGHDGTGALVAAWVEHDPSFADSVDWSRLDETSDRWSTESAIDGLVSEDATQLHLHNAPGGALLAFWSERHSSFGELDWSRLDETTDRWTAERALTSLTNTRDLAVLTDRRGQVVAAWSEADSVADDLRSASCGLW